MLVKNAERFKDYYIVINQEIQNNPMMVCQTSYGISSTKYIDDVICFEKRKDAKSWIDRHTYKGMTSKYKIAKIIYDYKGKRWDVK